MTDSQKLKVFLCHASQDKPVVRNVYQRLLSEGWIDPWLDEEKLFPGQDWNLEIEKAIKEANAVLVFLSGKSVTKEGYVQRELRHAITIAMEKPEGTIFILPVRLEDCEVPSKLRSYHYADYFPVERYEEAYQKILKSLELLQTALEALAANELVGPSNTVVLNKLGRAFECPREFLSSHIFFQVCRPRELKQVARILNTSQSGFSANFLSSSDKPKYSSMSFKEISNTSHLLITIDLWHLLQVPDGFWERMPCEKQSLIGLLEKNNIVFGIAMKDELYIFLVAAPNNELLEKGIVRFLQLTHLPE